MECKLYRDQYPDFTKFPLPREVWETPEWDAWLTHRQTCRDCSDWSLAQKVAKQGGDPKDHPCVHVAADVTYFCSEHKDLAECSHVLIQYDPQFDEYFIVKQTEYYLITHCPNCGTALPPSRRNAWYEELEAKGYDPNYEQSLPKAYLDDGWYRSNPAD